MAALTSRDRVLTALRHGIPDRVPYMELIVDEAFGLRLLGRPPAAEPPAMSGSTARYLRVLRRAGVRPG